MASKLNHYYTTNQLRMKTIMLLFKIDLYSEHFSFQIQILFINK